MSRKILLIAKSVAGEKTIVCGRWWDNDKINHRHELYKKVVMAGKSCG